MNLLTGDALAMLRGLEAASADALVTDPPAGISFMGKAWDDDKGGRDAWVAWMTDVMRECLRVLKPGAHGLVWALPRTAHWTATALEDAGFEVRDCVTHLFGTGFPKSLDISKAIDKAAGAEREVVGTKLGLPGYSLAPSNGDHKTYSRGLGNTSDPAAECAITAPTTEAAKQWQGWGTALKPACEFWWLVRKPLSEKTVAANVLRWGTGGLNIDASRIGTDQIESGGAGRSECESEGFGKKLMATDKAFVTGRFPANLVLDEEAAAALDEQSAGTRAGKPSGTGKVGPAKGGASSLFGNDGAVTSRYDDENVGASRFFYVAKASKKDRGDGNTHPTVKSTELMRYLVRLVTPPGGLVLDPFMGSGSTGVAATREGREFVGIEREEAYAKIAEARCS